jgi:hypothetical protein
VGALSCWQPLPLLPLREVERDGVRRGQDRHKVPTTCPYSLENGFPQKTYRCKLFSELGLHRSSARKIGREGFDPRRLLRIDLVNDRIAGGHALIRRGAVVHRGV